MNEEATVTSEENIKEVVKERYARIAEKSDELKGSSCCGSGPCECGEYTVFSDDYSQLEGYAADADLGLGCGLPTEYARIKAGDVVVDLGSGAGNDVFVARSLAGDSGRVIGVDMTETMVEKARQNNAKLGYRNVEFVLGEIEDLPIPDASTDVVISNCVLNLVPDKPRAFRQIYRVLKPGAHFTVSDVVLTAELPSPLRSAAEMYAGCVAGAIMLDEYLVIIQAAGFVNIVVLTQKPVSVPDEMLERYLSHDETSAFKRSGSPLKSVTVSATKPAQ